MDRRAFLHRLGLGLAAIVAAPRLLSAAQAPERAPKLWGDGIHDDTDALQWRIDRYAVLSLPPGVYKMNTPIRLP
jgi:hypothetical protein